MHQLLFAPQGMGLLARKEDVEACQMFPLQCEMSDYRNLTGTGRIEKGKRLGRGLEEAWKCK